MYGDSTFTTPRDSAPLGVALPRFILDKRFWICYAHTINAEVSSTRISQMDYQMLVYTLWLCDSLMLYGHNHSSRLRHKEGNNPHSVNPLKFHSIKEPPLQTKYEK